MHRYPKNRGFTLIELLIGVAITFILLIIVLFFVSKGCSHDIQEEHAKASAEQWAKELTIKVSGIACASQDSDNDGYEKERDHEGDLWKFISIMQAISTDKLTFLYTMLEKPKSLKRILTGE